MRFAFEGCVFDSDTREVFRGGVLAPLSPKAFRLLEILIENRPKAVSKQEIHEHLWPATFVSDANLGNLVAELRAALGDDAHEPRIIRTVHRFGYAFRAKTTAAADEGAPGEGQTAYRLLWGNREINLEIGENLLGRDRDAVVWIDDPSVSRRHARIRIGESGATIEDLGSKNGTHVGETKVGTQTRLQDNDVIKIGSVTMIFRVFQRTDSTASTVEERAEG